MTSGTCRLCNAKLPQNALLELHGMPSAAQHLPSLDDLDKDQGTDLQIFECTQCGLVQTCQAPVAYYKEVIRASAFSAEMADFRKQQLKAWVDKYQLVNQTSLEIGAGKGEYLQLLQQAGLKVVGTEFGEDSVQACHKLGLEVYRAFPDGSGLKLKSAPFDAFASFNFMEHWPHPKNTLRDVAQVLKPNALGLVEVPNFDMILKNNLFTEFISDHIFYFSAKTLRLMLEISGFEVLDIQSIWHDYILSAQVRKRTPLNASGFITKQQRIVEQLQQFVSRFEPKDVVVWGAGHQALAVMSLAKLQKSISHVVDSAPFKQNKYTPGTHLQIKSPESLLHDLPKAIVIMAASYSDEVARTISEQYPHIENVAILREEAMEIIKGGH